MFEGIRDHLAEGKRLQELHDAERMAEIMDLRDARLAELNSRKFNGEVVLQDDLRDGQVTEDFDVITVTCHDNSQRQIESADYAL